MALPPVPTSLQHARSHGDVSMDCYGTGEDLEAVRQEAQQRSLGLRFHGAKDHLDKSMHEYQVGRGSGWGREERSGVAEHWMSSEKGTA